MSSPLHVLLLRCQVKLRSSSTKQKSSSEVLTVITNQQEQHTSCVKLHHFRRPVPFRCIHQHSRTLLRRHFPCSPAPTTNNGRPIRQHHLHARGGLHSPGCLILFRSLVLHIILVVDPSYQSSIYYDPAGASGYGNRFRRKGRNNRQLNASILPTTRKRNPTYYDTFDNIHLTPHVTRSSDETTVVEAAAITSPPSAYTRTHREPRNVFVEAEGLWRNGSFNKAAMGGREEVQSLEAGGNATHGFAM